MDAYCKITEHSESKSRFVLCFRSYQFLNNTNPYHSKRLNDAKNTKILPNCRTLLPLFESVDFPGGPGSPLIPRFPWGPGGPFFPFLPFLPGGPWGPAGPREPGGP